MEVIKSALILTIALFTACLQAQETPFLVVLGIAQDAGYPQAACRNACCLLAENEPERAKKVCSLALVDPTDSSYQIFDMSPDFREQSRQLESKYNVSGPKAIYLTHAHIGHYAGLIFLGRESRASQNVPCYAMPRMRSFLQQNGPWSQLIELNNIRLEAMENSVIKTGQVSIEAIEVPHRDEFSETVGFFIHSSKTKVLFIPDIDKWGKWNQDIREWVNRCDYLFLDGTFYGASELKHRNMNEIPHPFIVESTGLFKDLSPEQKAKIHFIHLNHSNPLLWNDELRDDFLKSGFKLATEGQTISL